jgi:hypothetical protein
MTTAPSLVTMMPLLKGLPAVNAEYMKWPGMICLRLSALVVCPVAGACATGALRSSCANRKGIDGRTVRRRAADLVVMVDPPCKIVDFREPYRSQQLIGFLKST